MSHFKGICHLANHAWLISYYLALALTQHNVLYNFIFNNVLFFCCFFWLKMDVDLCAGGDSTKRTVELAGVAEGTMDVVPLEMYDSARAKIAANLRWLFAKAYGIGK